ncbi:Mut7-C RNAse domain-containing protein [Candidatus Bipolaricaulota sp. J31]
MGRATFRFYAELNDFLPRDRRFRDIEYDFFGFPTVKDAIEALGVPHVEVDLIVVNGEPVDFSYHLRDGDRVAVYPVFESLDISGISSLRPRPLRCPRFVADVHLGKLVRLLRLLGIDVVQPPDSEDEELVRISREEGRILLTRDRHLLKHGKLTHGYYVRADKAVEQVREVLRRFDLWREVRPFTRCLVCNGDLERVSKEEVLEEIPPRTAAWLEEYSRCRSCGKLYWPGTHYRRLRETVDRVLVGPPGEGSSSEGEDGAG